MVINHLLNGIISPKNGTPSNLDSSHFWHPLSSSQSPEVGETVDLSRVKKMRGFEFLFKKGSEFINSENYINNLIEIHQ